MSNLGLEDDNFDNDINPLETTGAYLSPKRALKKLFLDEDARCSWILKRLRVRPGNTSVALFVLTSAGARIAKQWVRDNKEKFMDKRVVVYCNWWVHQEKGALMVREGYKDVGQLYGGIATYGKDPEVQGELWDGKNVRL